MGAMAERLEPESIHHCARFVRCVYMRNNEAEPAAVQATRAQCELTVWHADQRSNPRVQRRHRNRIGGLDRGRPVLQVDEQKIEACGFHDPCDLYSPDRAHTYTDR